MQLMARKRLTRGGLHFGSRRLAWGKNKRERERKKGNWGGSSVFTQKNQDKGSHSYVRKEKLQGCGVITREMGGPTFTMDMISGGVD